jgi:hypothetical protein
LDLFDDKPDDILIWIGPHIEAGNYEVGEDVYQACTDRDKSLSVAFSKNTNGRWNASLKTMIYRELENREIRNISCADLCTYDQSADFFSYRREKTTGRMASMIWIDK